MIRYFIALTISLVFCTCVHAQQHPRLDSLTKKFNELSINDTTKIWILFAIADELMAPEGHPMNIEHNLDTAILVLNQVVEFSKAKNFIPGLKWSNNYLGRIHAGKGLRNQALAYFQKGLQIAEHYGDKLMTAGYHNEIGNIYLSLQREWVSDQMSQLALSHYKLCLSIALTFNSQDARVLVSVVTANIGQVFSSNRNYDSAIFYYLRCIELSKNTKGEDDAKISRQFDLIHVYEEQGDLKKALKLARQVLDFAANGKETKIKGEANLFDIYQVLASIHQQIKNYDSAFFFINKTIALSKKGINPYVLTNYYFQKGDFNKAILNAHQIIDQARSRSLVDPSIYEVISDAYAKQGNYKKAFVYHKLFSHMADSIHKENIAAKVMIQQAEYNAAKQTDAIDILEKKAEINSLAMAQQKQTQMFFAIILVLSLLIIVIVINRYRLIRKSKKEQEYFFKELDSLKSRFFANISHEFRTPLTLILGPLEKRLSVATDSSDKKELTIMHRNASRLLTLVNQLLDLSRLEAGTLKLQGHSQSLDEFLHAIASQFSSMADSKSINFKVLIDQPVSMFFDPDKMEKIITNLLSNAFKFTPAGGTITINLMQHEPNKHFKNGYAEIIVTDSGRGMGEAHLGKIFERFYQADTSSTREYEGSGIGLALTKELVELHHGSITVTSTEGKGSCFTIQLPLGTALMKASEIDLTEQALPRQAIVSADTIEMVEDGSHAQSRLRPSLLIVEDNSDLRFYLRSNLKHLYEIREAPDGEQGFVLALEEMPDLIITDLMMPRMDGLQFCDKLKTNEKTSHIPIILLTARADIETKLEGLNTGADDYMAKPFDARELEIRIFNLIESRKKLQQKFSRQFSLSASEIQIESIEDRFLKKIKSTIEAKIGDSALSVEILAEEAFMSSIQLYRKLKALTGRTPNELIRSIRMDRAASLLRQHSGNVSEVAYQVGFNNLSYFAKCFKEKFDLSPSEFANSFKI